MDKTRGSSTRKAKSDESKFLFFLSDVVFFSPSKKPTAIAERRKQKKDSTLVAFQHRNRFDRAWIPFNRYISMFGLRWEGLIGMSRERQVRNREAK